MLRTSLLALALVTVAACGGKAPATSTVTSEPEATPGAHAEHHPDLPPAMAAFHDRMAPLWHAAPGPQRTADTCAAARELVELGGGIATADAPAGVTEPGWTDGVSRFRDALGALADDCRDHEGAELARTFAQVHGYFHDLMGMIPGAMPHEGHDGH